MTFVNEDHVPYGTGPWRAWVRVRGTWRQVYNGPSPVDALETLVLFPGPALLFGPGDPDPEDLLDDGPTA